MLAEYDSKDSFQRHFVYGNYIDEPVLMSDASNDYYYAQDHLYSSAALLNSSGSVIERYEYDAYGNPYILDDDFSDDDDGLSDCSNPYLFTGRRIDFLDSGNLKLQYNRNRYYDYYTGRWLTHDPLGITSSPYSSVSEGINLFEYANSSPGIFSDPYGTRPIECPSKCETIIQRPGFIPSENGCGTGPFVYLVPDSVADVDFTEPCNTHDRCYTEVGKTKAACDKGLQNDMKVRCEISIVPMTPFPMDPITKAIVRAKLKACYKVADTYYKAVDKLGESAHTKAQKKGTCCSDDPTSKSPKCTSEGE